MAASTRSRHQQAGRLTQGRSKRKSYREVSTSSEEDSSDESSADYKIRTRPLPRTRTATEPSLHSRSQQSSRKRKAAPIRLPQSRNKKARIEVAKTQEGIATDCVARGGKIPAWHTLPYHILVQIFHYVAKPLVDDTQLSTSSIRWLLRTARVCKAFSEPAISVLYYSPPLDPPYRAHGLLAHLQGQNGRSLFNYRAKVKYLDIQLSFTGRRYQGRYLEMGELLAVVPQLRGLGMHRVEDILKVTAAMGEPISSKTTAILHNTIVSLQLFEPSLQEWKWNAVASRRRMLFDLNKIHRTTPFQNLRRLTFAHFDARESNEKHAEKPEEELALSISALPNLTELRFVLCSDLNAKLLPLLPPALQVLEISDCPVDSKTMGKFLTTHGQKLHRLILDHNQSLNLEFLVDLAESCPLLEVLKMDLTYHNAHFTYTDIEPRYEELLLPGQVPTWPASLQHLELIHLRKWDNDTANDFFNSLVDYAGDLPNLRRLMIKASLNESGWRERVSFRDRWVARLERIFLRKANPPNPYLHSIAAFKEAKAKNFKGYSVKETPRKSPKVIIQVPPRKPPLLEQSPTRPKRNLRSRPESNRDTAPESTSDSDAPLATKRRRSSRLARDDSEAYTSQNTPQPRHRHRYRRRRRSKNSDEESSSEDSALDDPVSAPTTREASIDLDADDGAFVIQGMCDVVKIQIDNLRPMEEMMGEDDFIDEEAPGDGDWNGDDVDEADGLAW